METVLNSTFCYKLLNEHPKMGHQPFYDSIYILIFCYYTGAKVAIFFEIHKKLLSFPIKPRGKSSIRLIKPRGKLTFKMTKPRGNV